MHFGFYHTGTVNRTHCTVKYSYGHQSVYIHKYSHTLSLHLYRSSDAE